MTSPQTGIFALGTGSHAYLELDLIAGVAAADAVARVAALREPRTTIGGVNLVTGFRPELWAAVAPDATPPGVVGFNDPLIGPAGYVLPATQHDVVLWLTGSGYDTVFDLSRGIATALADVAVVANEMVGWPYHHDRDLTGFIDGTENPSLLEAPAVVTVPDGPGAGSSVVLFQVWRHDTAAWESLGVYGQEQAMGRTKDDSTEFAPEDMPASAHVARTTVEVDGEEQRIFRRNVAYGGVTDHGTAFVGFARDQWRLAEMLRRMAGATDRVRDGLTHWLVPLTGAYYTVPAVEALARFAPAEQ